VAARKTEQLMSFDACPLPVGEGDDDSDVVRRLIKLNHIAIVGLSDDPSRPSFGVASYLLSVGKVIIPVNPNHAKVLGQTCYPSLEAIPMAIELVDVFRRPEHCAEVARSAVKIGAKGLWLQSGIVNEQARQIARSAGMDYVEDRCLMVELMHGRK
jgi:predicted CoA-binding protein